MAMKTYAQAFAPFRRSTDPINLLLGSGFSCANDPRYGYPALLHTSFPRPGSRARRVFATSATTDFEQVLGGLQSAAVLASNYGPAGRRTAAALMRDRAAIATGFRRALARTHHPTVADIMDAQYDRARLFLTPFKNIFTLNYDLLLYWALNRDGRLGKPPRTDGFLPQSGKYLWAPRNSQQVHWLHGGLHLFPYHFTVEKLAFATTQKPLMEEILARVATGQFPLLILEGTRQQKECAIASTQYLQHSLDALRSLTGSLVVFGCGVSERDGHIRDAIQASHLTRIAVGLRPASSDASDIQSTWIGAVSMIPRKTRPRLVFFDATTAPVW